MSQQEHTRSTAAADVEPTAPAADAAAPSPLDPETAAALRGGAVVLVAMDEEEAPFLDRGTALAEPVRLGHARATALRCGAQTILLVRTGIGLANAASAAAAALLLARPRAVVSAGSAGGLHAEVEVGDVVVGTDYAYTDADATAFGYVRGQVPGMPASYPGDEDLLAAARALPAQEEGVRRFGPMLAGGSFVTAANVADTRQAFPRALSTDMETTAIAQVAAGYGVPFLSVRGISDLCGPAADQDFHLAVEIVAERSARTVLALLDAA
ncbi:5'-methylthioadenosine/S-adenosylhomocysteine nucleosidase [Rothia kristinae]|uniref:5'-methylthioadenosine/S-adenosylhomocysteine nucleosidase n=1 Tax=Rothia kristinae TaxID=37923 RepID=UPI00092827A6|nr:5'-methylthioadenosine/S-adenosylhomocysteine nucleosidase [Rothia kristinae]MED6047505.1 5'-methylthioadenosine/S-adenosylhomocysteine nucleosidase [Rothia kristinae]TDP56229.1 adenosylhomocysteine nucleosidase [Kocuria sp. AG109]SIM33812.1 methylthioadenosine nucleosidase [Mycobacteroides abscessus subsp. abscessus]SQC37324.1 5'-methylthioadenosine/S-adenosylhomocysteine nucleosidase [Rothia kristinae]